MSPPPLLHRQTPRRLCAWFAACAAGGGALIMLFTGYGLLLVCRHAGRLGREAELLSQFSLSPLISAGDPALCSWTHLVSSALFFGLTTGLLMALSCTVVSTVWLRRHDRGSRYLSLAILGGLGVWFCHSGEVPVLSCVWGLLSPVVFYLTWRLVMGRIRDRTVALRAWIIFLIILALPGCLLAGSSFLRVRDALISSPRTAWLSDAYYEHTLLAADVIKPPASRSQLVVAVDAPRTSRILRRPHGTLWLRTADPCVYAPAALVLSDRAPCADYGAPAAELKRDARSVVRAASRTADPNRLLRRGVGTALRLLPLAGLFVIAWAAFGLAAMHVRHPLPAVFLVVACLACLAPAPVHCLWEWSLNHDPAKLETYVTSPREYQRYLAALEPDLDAAQIRRLLTDESPRIRLNALISVGKSGDRSHLPSVISATGDGQINVRTKACWALGRLGGPRAVDTLERVRAEDPSWYVRDYAFGALGRLHPRAPLVDIP